MSGGTPCQRPEMLSHHPPERPQLHVLSSFAMHLLLQAPEVMSGETPGPSADVYSFALLLWSLTSLEEPFAGTQTWQVGWGGKRAMVALCRT